MRHQFAQPLGIVHVGLASRHMLDVMGVYDEERKLVFERLASASILARAFHGDRSGAQLSFLEPVGKGE